MDIKQILNNKKTYLILAGVVGLGAIIYLAIFFGVGNLLKGNLTLPITCAATPAEIPLDGKSHDVTWKAYSAGSTAKGDWSGYLPGLPSQIDVTTVNAHYLGTGQDGETRTVTVTGDPTKYSPNTADCSITFKKPAQSNITLLNNNIQFQQLGGCSPVGDTRTTSSYDQNGSQTCTETCQADGTWGLKICAYKSANPPAGADKTSTWGVKGCGTNPAVPMINQPLDFELHATNKPATTFSYDWKGTQTKTNDTCASNKEKASCTFAQGGTVTMNLKMTQTASPFDYAQTSCKTVISICESGKTQLCDGGKGTQECMGPQWGDCSSTNPPSNTCSTPGTTKLGTCNAGYHVTCSTNGTWGTSCESDYQAPPSGECTNGDTQPCNNGNGEQTCSGGQWGSCISTGGGTVCTDNDTQPCNNGSGEQTCSGGQWGSCISTGLEPPGVEPPGDQTGTAFNNMQINDSLKDEQELITCNGGPDTFSAKQNESISVRCTLLSTDKSIKKPLLTAKVVKGAFDPANGIASKNDIIKNFIDDLPTDQGAVSFNWNGKRYGQPVDPGEYTFIMAARLSKDYNYNYFLKKFSVTEESAKASTSTTTDQTVQAPQEQVSTINQQPTPAQQEQPQAEQPAVAPPEPSKCPGVNYPSDIKGHWAEAIIKTAVDDCKSTGFADGTWRPDRNISRFEAVKLIIAQIGQPKSCYDADCGTPFVDLEMSMGPWVRAAWDLNISKGYGIYFLPNRPVSRAEAAAMIVRAFPQKLLAFRGCYTPNCGAGYPNNLFVDIHDSWSGKYIRALWDKGLIKGTGPYMFEPDRAITRAEFLKLVMSAKAL